MGQWLGAADVGTQRSQRSLLPCLPQGMATSCQVLTRTPYIAPGSPALSPLRTRAPSCLPTGVASSAPRLAQSPTGFGFGCSLSRSGCGYDAARQLISVEVGLLGMVTHSVSLILGTSFIPRQKLFSTGRLEGLASLMFAMRGISVHRVVQVSCGPRGPSSASKLGDEEWEEEEEPLMFKDVFCGPSSRDVIESFLNRLYLALCSIPGCLNNPTYRTCPLRLCWLRSLIALTVL